MVDNQTSISVTPETRKQLKKLLIDLDLKTYDDLIKRLIEGSL